MLFSSREFLFFFLPIVLTLYYVVLRKRRGIQNTMLFVASVVFYAVGEPKFVLVMLLSIILNWGMGIFVDRYREKKTIAHMIIASTVILNLSIIFVFKYMGFTISNINYMMRTNITIPNIALPIGISFFTFQALSYVIDVYRQQGEVQRNILNVGLYISFFPQLIAGPIVRYQTVAKEIKSRRETWNDFTSGTVRFILGFSKKILLSNTMAVVADKAFYANSIGGLTVGFAWIGALAYSLQIFFDFSGYSDMAIGLGKMFGFHFLENFNYPYISRSITEFWRRWHISLSTWFRDYIYIPLGGNRVKSKTRLFFNLFVVWLLTGIWHGANWTFIIWGLMYFLLLCFEKVTGLDQKETFNIPRRVYTLLFVMIGWVIFRAENISLALEYLKTMAGSGKVKFWIDTDSLYLKENIIFFISGIILSTPVIKLLGIKMKMFSRKLENCMEVISAAIILGLFLISISYLVKGSYNPFIYFNF